MELLELEEEAKDDETERRIREYHEKRIEKERKEAQRARFGRVYPIGRDDYTREVTDASKIDEPGDDEGKGTRESTVQVDVSDHDDLQST